MQVPSPLHGAWWLRVCGSAPAYTARGLRVCTPALRTLYEGLGFVALPLRT